MCDSFGPVMRQIWQMVFSDRNGTNSYQESSLLCSLGDRVYPTDLYTLGHRRQRESQASVAERQACAPAREQESV
jgi:hypothetical protein